MTAAYFEDHPTDPDKVILRKPGYLSDCAIELQRERKKLHIAIAALTDIATNKDTSYNHAIEARKALNSIKEEHK